MADTRHKNAVWGLPVSGNSYESASLAVLMDIRDELQAIRRLGECWRVARGFDAMIELGKDARRKERAAARKRKAARERAAP